MERLFEFAEHVRNPPKEQNLEYLSRWTPISGVPQRSKQSDGPNEFGPVWTESC